MNGENGNGDCVVFAGMVRERTVLGRKEIVSYQKVNLLDGATMEEGEAFMDALGRIFVGGVASGTEPRELPDKADAAERAWAHALVCLQPPDAETPCALVVHGLREPKCSTPARKCRWQRTYQTGNAECGTRNELPIATTTNDTNHTNISPCTHLAYACQYRSLEGSDTPECTAVEKACLHHPVKTHTEGGV